MLETNYNEIFESVLKKYIKYDGKLKEKLKVNYSTKLNELPQLRYKNGEVADNRVLAYLLLAGGKPVITTDFDKPDSDSDIQRVLALLDYDRFKEALYELAITYLPKRINLACPIRYYADEELVDKLINYSSQWKPDSWGIIALNQIAVKSKRRSAMMFADKCGYLDYYAEYNNTDDDTLRDKYLSDVGLNESGEKRYDLGIQVVTAKMQKDFSFVFESENGKVSKSLPKRGADIDLYETAKADFTKMKENIKSIVRIRKKNLYYDFLNGSSRNSQDWKEAYLKNPVLRTVASLVVWSQDNNTFTLDDTGAITSSGANYQITNADITVAHPIEMNGDDISAWQKYFTINGIKQPFEQIWEPVINPDTIQKNRYANCMIPYYRFANQEKRGITIENYDYNNEIIIEIYGFKTVIERIDYERHTLNYNHNFEIEEISFEKFTRRVNHIIAYFDRITVADKIAKDDISFAEVLSSFTLAQIIEFIDIASENHAINAMAVLLDHRNKKYADYDPMSEFVLD